MEQYSVILVDIDPNHAYQPALEKALSFVQQQKVKLVLYIGIFQPAIEASHLLDATALSDARQHIIDRHVLQLSNLVQTHARQNVEFDTHVSWHAPLYQGIIQSAHKHHADLIIKSSAPHPLSQRIFFTPNDWQLLKASPVPVLLTKGQQLKTNAAIIGAVDPMHKLSKSSQLDAQILKASETLAHMTKSAVHVCHCFDPDYWQLLVTYLSVSGVWSDVYPDQTDADPKNMLNSLKGQYQHGFKQLCDTYKIKPGNRHFIDGNITDKLPALITQLNAGTVVVGTSYRTGWLGSTAQWLLESVGCDILAVKPEGFETPVNLV